MKSTIFKKVILITTLVIAAGAFLSLEVAYSQNGQSGDGEEIITFSKVYSQNGVYIDGKQISNSISFTINVPKISISQILGNDGITYHKISMPDSNFLTRDEGGPQLPYISELIYIPDQAVNLSVQATIGGSPISYQDILVYPCPKTVVKTTDEGYEYLAEEFYLDPAKYSQQDLMPGQIAEITDDGYFRSARMIRVNIFPVRYAPASKVLKFAKNITVTIAWAKDEAIQSKKDTTNGFEKVISEMILNYGAFKKEKVEIEESFLMHEPLTQGALIPQEPVTYISGPELLDTNIDCDYLIITHLDFFSTAALADFANYRANYNNLRIVITKVDDIYTQFPNNPNGNGNDYSIKDFIQYAYDNWQTSPQYLLIVGDVEYVPSHRVMHLPCFYMDYEEWYVCVAGGDEWPDLAMGRFSIKDQNDITSIKNKIFAYEQDPVLQGDYHKKALYVEGSFAHEQEMIDILFNAGFEVSELYQMDGNTWQDFKNAVDSGRNIVYWIGHGGPKGWEYGNFQNDLSLLNNSNYPVILTDSCHTASLTYDVSIGEEFVKIDGKGAVAYYGATIATMGGAAYETLIETFDGYEYDLGKAILLGEINSVLDGSKENILLGDPALQTFGYKLNQGLPDLTLPSSGVNYDYSTKQLTLSVANIGNIDATNVLTRTFIVDYATGGEYPFGECLFPMIPAGGSVEAIIDIPPPFNGEYLIIGRVDPENKIAESCEINNQNGRRLLISPTFVDVTDESGIDPTRKHQEIARADINGDGYTDIYFAYECGIDGETQLFLNNGNGTFSDITEIAGVRCIGSYKAVFGDINNDGYPDLYVCRDSMDGLDRLFVNNGDGTFRDITDYSGISGYGSTEAIFGDIDSDGDLDIFISSGKTSKSFLFINNGYCLFTDGTSDCGLDDLGFSPMSRFADIDNDGDSDLLLTGNGYPRFYLNDGTGFFVQETPQIIGSNTYDGISISDIDLDGDSDLMFLLEDEFELFRNNGGGVFEKVEPYILQRIAFWSDPSSTLFAEIDNVAGEDILWGKYLIRNSPGGLFENYENILYGDEICSLPVDIEGDGDNDLITGSYSNMRVLQNQTDNNKWLKVKPVGTLSNRDAIGAKVYLYSSGGDLIGFQEISSQAPAPVHVGVNASDTYKIVIVWPASGIVDVVNSVSPAQLITIVEGIGVVRRIVTPGKSIQEAINSSFNNEAIYVIAGIYTEDIFLENKGNLCLMGDVNGTTTIEGTVSFEDSNSSIERFSILYKGGGNAIYSNGYYTDFKLLKDAGITAINSEITVRDCIIMPDPRIFSENKFGKSVQIWNLYGSEDIEPIIENNLILNADAGIYLYSHASGGTISGEIKNNTLDLNNYGIVMRMYKENPHIHHNIITRSQEATYLNYYSFLSERTNNITDNSFGGGLFDNARDIRCEQNENEWKIELRCISPSSRGGGSRRGRCFYWNNNIDSDPEYIQEYEYPDYIYPVDLDYTPYNQACEDKGCRF